MTYFRAIDPYPLQSPQQNKLHEFYERLAGGQFVTTRCSRCARESWPPRAFCDACASDEYEWVELPAEGTIHAFSIQETGVPVGFDAPLIFAVVRLRGLRVFARLVETAPADVAIGARVRPVAVKVAPDAEGLDRHLIAFRVVTA